LATPLHMISGSENQAIHYPMHNMWTGSGVNPYSMYNPGSMMAYGNQTSRLDASSMLMQSPHLPVSASHVSSPGLSRMQHKAGHTGSHATPPGLHGGATSLRVDDHLFSAAQHTLQSQRNFDMQHGYPGWTKSSRGAAVPNHSQRHIPRQPSGLRESASTAHRGYPVYPYANNRQCAADFTNAVSYRHPGPERLTRVASVPGRRESLTLRSKKSLPAKIIEEEEDGQRSYYSTKTKERHDSADNNVPCSKLGVSRISSPTLSPSFLHSLGILGTAQAGAADIGGSELGSLATAFLSKPYHQEGLLKLTVSTSSSSTTVVARETFMPEDEPASSMMNRSRRHYVLESQPDNERAG
jgi:hypothetical protein